MEISAALWREAFGKGLVRWMPGMRAVSPDGSVAWRCVWSGLRDDDQTWHDETKCWLRDPQQIPGDREIFASMLPDADDPATIGCILAMAREAARDPELHVEWNGRGGWDCWFIDTSSATEPEALLRAILAAGGTR